MSLDDRITGKDAPPPAPPLRPRPRQALPVAGSTALTVQPGQTLVLAMADASMAPERAQQMREQLAARLPGVEVVILGGVAQMAVYDPAESA